jgi:hypothetical protein
MDLNGQPLIPPTLNDVSPPSPLPFSKWPLQFTATTDKLCIYSHFLVNSTALNIRDSPIALTMGFVPLSAQQLSKGLGLIATGHTESDDPLVLQYAGEVVGQTPFTFSSTHDVRFRVNKIIRLNGSVELDYVYDTGKDIPFVPRGYEFMAQTWLSTISNTSTAEYIYLQSLLVDALNNPETKIKYLATRICFAPDSFQVQVVTEVAPYGSTNFISDLGGFTNLLTVALLFLFPLLHSPPQPRVFLPMMLLAKWRARSSSRNDASSTMTEMGSSLSATKGGVKGNHQVAMMPIQPSHLQPLLSDASKSEEVHR